MSKDRIQIALWQRDVRGDKSQPILKGNIEFPDGTKKDVSLWVSKSKHPNAPTYTGQVDSWFDHKTGDKDSEY